MNQGIRFFNRRTRLVVLAGSLAGWACLAAVPGAARPTQAGGAAGQQRAGGIITGQVRSATEPVSFATILLLGATDSTVVQALTSDENGRFTFAAIAAGSYRVRASFVAYRTFTTPVFQLGRQAVDLGTLLVQPGNVALGEVTVTGNKPLIERKADRLVFNAGSSVRAATGSAWDLVRVTPGVMATAQGTLSIAGKKGVQVMINNRLRRLSAEELADYLKQLPGTAVESIEVITNPPANYDAEGNAGLLNIVTKHNENEGLNGTARLAPEQGVLPKLSGSANLNYRRDKLNLYAAYSGRLGKDRFNEATKLFYENAIWDQHDKITRRGYGQTASVGADYYLNKRDVLGVLLEVTASNRRAIDDIQATAFRPGHAPDSLLYTDVNTGIKRVLTSVNANYRHDLATPGGSLAVDFDYTPYRSSNDQLSHNVTRRPEPGAERVTDFTSATTQRTDIGSLKVDYVRPLPHGLLLESGAKLSMSATNYDLRFDNIFDGQLVNDPARTNRFSYREAIQAGYATVSRSAGKLNAKAGLRAEYTQTMGQSSASETRVNRDYFRLFPTLFAQYKASDTHEYKFSYGVRINRPSYAYLNPFVFYLSPYVTATGNPYLRPSFSHTLEGTYTYQGKYELTLSYQRVLDPFMQVAQLDNATNQVAFVRLNTNPRNVYSATLVLPVQVLPSWKVDAVITGFARQESILYLGTDLAYFKPTVMVAATNTFSLPKRFALQVDLTYVSPYREFVQVIGPVSDVSLSVRKKFANGSSLSLSVNDIFFGNAPRYYTDYPTQRGEYYNTSETRNVGLAYVYAFGNQKLKSARDRATGNQEERGRTN
jgi:iron complex outermembrane receptor protein